MSRPDRPTGAEQSQTALSEAVEQAADAARQWSDDLTKFAKDEADKLASNKYGLNDLVAAPVSLMRIWVKNTMNTVSMLQDNLALVSHVPPRAPASPRTVRVRVHVPANVGGTLAASAMVGRDHGYRISSSRVRVVSEPVVAEATPKDIVVAIEVDDPDARNDTYDGHVYSADRSISAPFSVAIDELGEPLV